MPEPKMEELHPVTVTVIGTKADDIPAPGTVAVTPKQSQPNLIVNVVTPIAAIFIRFGNLYMISILGLITTGMTTDIIPFDDFTNLVVKSGKAALVPAALGFGKDLITVFGKLERKYPLATCSV